MERMVDPEPLVVQELSVRIDVEGVQPRHWKSNVGQSESGQGGSERVDEFYLLRPRRGNQFAVAKKTTGRKKRTLVDTVGLLRQVRRFDQPRLNGWRNAGDTPRITSGRIHRASSKYTYQV